ncbi:hypothetical protein pETSU_256 [Edwardsiella phage pEt-SU]|uniref:Uncharacterized protein n=1 Tax=Edwardsiella phage pEt-SU TaxID=2562142 RepID=A0A4D6DWV3_9CAUD|nr:hypothetical protein HOV39_gp266 [Edwardsiella phage pEt-SU]QBZ70837.1 hypothetical protein pETSU_256 [Edwardsiella phage pEt-SU]
MTTQAQYYIDALFCKCILHRLTRSKIPFSRFCFLINKEVEEVNAVFQGRAPIGSIVTFYELDRIFGTTDGYHKAVYDNCAATLMLETSCYPESEKVPPATVTITVDLLKRLSNAALDYHYQNPAGKEGWSILTELGVKEDDE